MRRATKNDPVEIAPYDPAWPAKFDAEARLVRSIIPDDIFIRIEHFGSTAVPGLAAKPVIDILLGVSSLERTAGLEAEFGRFGYQLWPITDTYHGTLFLIKIDPATDRRSFHVHATTPGHAYWKRLLFRDYLRRFPDEAERYESVKRTLAERHPNDREAYADGKDKYVDEVTARAAAFFA